jgi:hypothetical protein
MADKLTDDVALALLGNTLPTGAMLVVLSTILGPVSGAHFSPQSGGFPRLCIKARYRLVHGSALCDRPDCRRHRRHDRRASDVRPFAGRSLAD